MTVKLVVLRVLTMDNCKVIALDNIGQLANSDELEFINIMHLNVRSLVKNQSNLLGLLDDLNSNHVKIHVIALCETFLTPLNEQLVKIPGYHATHRFRKKTTGGGVSILLHESVTKLSVINTPFVDCVFESLAIKIQLNSNVFIVSEYYRSPNSNFNLFMSEYDNYCQILMKEKRDLSIVCTDQNIDLLKVETSETKRFVDMNSKYMYLPVIDKPTRVTYNTCTLIDNIYIHTKKKYDYNSMVLISDVSDHYPCLLQIGDNNSKRANSVKYVKTRKFTDENIFKLNHALLHHDWSNLHMIDVNSVYEYLSAMLSKYINETCPEKTKVISSRQCFIEPWLNVNIMRYNKKCKKLFLKSINAPNDTNMKRYRDYRCILNKIKRVERAQYYETTFHKIGNNMKNMWSVLNGLIKKTNNKTDIETLLVNGTKITDKKKIVDSMNEHFVNIGKKTQEQVNFENYVNYRVTSNLLLSPTTDLEITKIINTLKMKTSHGHDKISNVLLKKVVNSIRLPLLIIFNNSLKEGVFPDLMKKAKVRPLYKCDNPQICDNYRPISLLPVLSKVLEKIVYRRLTGHLESNDILYKAQFGFRSNHSTHDAIETFIGNCIEGLDRDLKCLCVFIDLKKAFDTVNHRIILRKLELMGVNGTALQWFESYLSDRKQYTEMDGFCSDTCAIDAGVPQGSLLGVLLFQLEINDMFKCLKQSMSILYADDTTLYILGKNVKCLEAKMQRDLNLLSRWLQSNSLLLNIKKTKFMIISKCATILVDPVSLTVDSDHIEQVSDFKFLGLHIDQQLKFDVHCNALHSKLQKIAFLMGKLKSFLPLRILKYVYFAHFYSRLTYGIRIWGNSASKNGIKTIWRLQKRIVKLLDNKGFRDSPDPCFKQLKVLKLADIITLENVKLAFRVHNDLAPSPLMNLFDKQNRRKSRNLTFLVKRHTSSLYNNSFLCTVVCNWNGLQNELKVKTTLASFKSSVTQKLMSNY